jgi:hypothetical protein
MKEPKLLSPHKISVRKIKTISLYIDEFNIAVDAIFKIDFNRQYYVVEEQDVIILNLEVKYSVPNGELERRPVLQCMIHNAFEVENVKEFRDESNLVKLPLDLLASLVGMAVTHARAIISVHTAGTALGDTLLPVINPVEFTKALFDEASHINRVPHLVQ